MSLRGREWPLRSAVATAAGRWPVLPGLASAADAGRPVGGPAGPRPGPARPATCPARLGAGPGRLGTGPAVLLGRPGGDRGVTSRGTNRVAPAPGERGAPGSVARGDQQAAEDGEVLEEVDALLCALLLVLDLPEPVAGGRGGHQRDRDRRGRQPREDAQRQQRAGRELDGTVEAHRVLGGRHAGHELGERGYHRLRPRGHPFGKEHGVKALDDENRRQHRACGISQHTHGRHLPRAAGVVTSCGPSGLAPGPSAGRRQAGEPYDPGPAGPDALARGMSSFLPWSTPRTTLPSMVSCSISRSARKSSASRWSFSIATARSSASRSSRATSWSTTRCVSSENGRRNPSWTGPPRYWPLWSE